VVLNRYYTQVLGHRRFRPGSHPVPRQRCLDMTSNEAIKKLLEKRAALEKRALEKMEKRAAKAAKTQVTCSRLGRSGK